MLDQVRTQLTDDHLFLVGRPPISQFMSFVRSQLIGDSRSIDEDALAREWQDAEEHVEVLAGTEGGSADGLELTPLPDEMTQLAEEARKNGVARRALRYVPRQWYMVELDRMVVYQRSVNLTYVERIKEALPEKPSDVDLIRLAIGTMLTPPEVQITNPSPGAYHFATASQDFRFLDVTPLDPALIQGFQPSGYPCKALAVFVGFGINIASAVQVGDRVILGNGTHRAYALRELGVTHMPLLVARHSGQRSMELTLPPEVNQAKDLYLAAPRPPMFKDYFDPRLRKQIRAPRRHQSLQLKLTMESIPVPAM